MFAERAHTRKINQLQPDVLINPQTRSLVSILVTTVKGYPLWSTLVSVCEFLHVRAYNRLGNLLHACVCLKQKSSILWNFFILYYFITLLLKCIIDKAISWEGKLIPFESRYKFWDLYIEQANSKCITNSIGLLLSTTLHLKKNSRTFTHLEWFDGMNWVWPVLFDLLL